MRYGTDDPTLWPQQWTERYCHFPVIAEKATRPDLHAMWWDPSPADFVVGSAITRGLGRLSNPRMSRLTAPIDELVARVDTLRLTSQKPIAPLFDQLVQTIHIWTEQLRTLPTKYNKMVFGITSLQRAVLELDALYNYIMIYKPRIEQALRASRTGPILPTVLPSRNASGFYYRSRSRTATVGGTLVPLLEPDWISSCAAGTSRPEVTYSGNSTLEKIAAIHRDAVQNPWYHDPFETTRVLAPPPAAQPSSAVPVASSSHSAQRSNELRHKPYPVKSSAPVQKSPVIVNVSSSTPWTASPPKGPAQIARDKFTALTLIEMPPSIAAWAGALAQVDRSVAPFTSDPADRRYVLPEPALLVNSTPERRRKFLHHWNLLSDGFVYMLSNPQHTQLLSAQEWRDAQRGPPGAHMAGVGSVEGLPVPIESLPHFSLEQTREIVWRVAESSFRFEFCTLDKRASGKNRMEDVRICFAGHMLLGVPLEMSKHGWAAPAVDERHRYVLRTARLMQDWVTRSPRPRIIALRPHWSPADMQELENTPTHPPPLLFYSPDEAHYQKTDDKHENPSTSRLATSVPKYKITIHTNTPPKCEERYHRNKLGRLPPPTFLEASMSMDATTTPPFMAAPEVPGEIPAYETTAPCDAKGNSKTRQNIAHMNELKEQEELFIQALLGLHHDSLLLTPCSCDIDKHVRKVACRDCLQAPLLCPQCWLNAHRMMPTHWGFVWNVEDRFFEKHDFCRVMKNTVVALGHNGQRCPDADPGRSFTLVDGNGIHASAVAFCRCKGLDGKCTPEFQQLLRAGIFPGSVKEPKTGYTLTLLDYYRQERSQGKGSAYNFVHVLQRMADPFFADSVPDIYANFLAITRFYKKLDLVMRRGHAHRPNDPLPGEIGRPYPNRPTNFLGLLCAACPERGVNMPLLVNVPRYLRHIISQHLTLDGNFKANLFFKRDDGSDKALTDAVFSYDSWCSFVVNLVPRAIVLFPEETWLHTLLALVEGQIPADHINGHGPDCQSVWQAVYFACRAHFHGETVEMLWAFLNPLGSSTRQMTGAARHDTINFVMDTWNTRKLLRQAELLADERLDALRLFELHMAVVEDLSRQHTTEEHPLEDTWATITKLRDMLNADLKKFRERQREIYPRLTLSGLDIDEPELTAIQLPSYHRKHGQRAASAADATDQDSELRTTEIKLRCGEANSGILAVRAASLALSSVKKARDLDYRGQVGKTRSQRNLQKAELMKFFEIDMYNRAQAALIHLGHMAKEDVEPYPPLSARDTHRKETHLHRAKGDSRLFDGTAWYLQSGVTISRAAVASTRGPINGEDDVKEDEPQLLAGTQTLKRSGWSRSQRLPKHLKDIAPDDVIVESSSSSSEAEDSDVALSPSKGWGKPGRKKKKKKAKKSDGWIWMETLTWGQSLDDAKLAEYKKESDRVQWFRAEAEMYRWLEQYERKHAELMRIITRFHRDSVVWEGRANREEENNGGVVNGAATFARMQAAMHKRLEHNARVIFKRSESGAHYDWVSATTFDELVTKIDGWREVVFRWMDDMGIHRAYKDF
ncbi:hypothetical protein B0H10DRAFT_2217097 [Mycena sp. CBHHK59/15]|nr:hypothetical protein B0H10DRAFT_2217097 [Mycena sp. CBHHK59/15]